MAPAAGNVVAYEDGTWVTTDQGPVHLEQGEPLPENVHPNEVARLANAGLLEGIDQAPELAGTLDANDAAPDPDKLPDGNIGEIKIRVGTDPETAQAYLEREQASEKPRPTLVAHLEQVIADSEDSTDPGTPLVDETRDGHPGPAA